MDFFSLLSDGHERHTGRERATRVTLLYVRNNGTFEVEHSAENLLVAKAVLSYVMHLAISCYNHVSKPRV